MRLLSAGGAGGWGPCCSCAVPGALFFCVVGYLDCTIAKNCEHETQHPSIGGTGGMLKGAMAGTLAAGLE